MVKIYELSNSPSPSIKLKLGPPGCCVKMRYKAETLDVNPCWDFWCHMVKLYGEFTVLKKLVEQHKNMIIF